MQFLYIEFELDKFRIKSKSYQLSWKLIKFNKSANDGIIAEV